MTTTLDRVQAAALRVLLPPMRETLTTFMKRDIWLPADVSATPGRYEPWAFHPGILDACTDPTLERVTVIKSVRTGLTTAITGAVANYIANDPANILVLLPTESDCRDFVVSDLEPIFAASPRLAGLLSDDENPDGRNTLQSRRYPGGSLKVVAAKSPRNLRKHNVRVLLMDEVDAMTQTAEGSPLTLAERRTLSFANRKIIAGSTPTDDLTSNVARLYEQGDQRIYESACPSCGALFEILWEHIEWETDRPETAACRCPHCRDLIDERHKPAMVAAGAWRATRPEVVGHASFRLNALISPLVNASWGRLAAEFLRAKSSPDELRVFVNTILGQVWRETADTIDESALIARAEPFGLESIPAEVLFVTVGADVQHDRIEALVMGHDRDGGALILGQRVFWGAPLVDDDPWSELDDLLKSSWRHPGGGTLRVDASFIDSGDGTMVDRVYQFCRPRTGRRVYPIKGIEGFKRQLIERSKAKGVTLILVASAVGKSQVFSRLGHGQSIRFSADLPERFYEELLGERCVIHYSRGMPIKRWVRVPGRRNEGLDCTVYALAARSVVQADIDRRAAELSSPVAPVADQRREYAPTVGRMRLARKPSGRW